MKQIIIAIDGYSACGKSTTAKRVAKALGYIFIDTGAMYRGVALYFLRNSIPVEKETPEMHKALEKISLRFFREDGGDCNLILNGEHVEDQIRTMKVSSVVSEVAALKAVRDKLVEQQREMGEKRGIVMDGRDIGTVVFPDAELKFFMTATMEKRVERRQLQLQRKGIYQSAEEIEHNIQHRDRIDTSREESPLRRADDALLLDTTNITIDQQVNTIVEAAKELITNNPVPNAQS